MVLERDRYTYRVTWSEDDSEYVGLCVEFPSMSWLAETPEAALAGIRDVVAHVVADMQESGERPPTPLATEPCKGSISARVPPHVHRQLKIEAAEAGVSLNRWVAAKLMESTAPNPSE
jgi:predicted HicB family RNase H-like nuclease